MTGPTPWPPTQPCVNLARALTLAVLLLLGRSAHAAESRPHVTPRATVTLVSDTDTAPAGAPYHLGLRFRLAPGWHIYTRNPGDAGLSPELTWTLPAGTTAGAIAWPAPQRLTEGELVTHGYTGEVLLAVEAKGPGPIRLQANWLICANICVPEDARFTLNLPAGPATPAAEAALFARAALALPRPSPWAARIAPDGTLALSGVKQGAIRDAWFVADDAEVIHAAAPQTLRETADGVTLELAPADGFKPGARLSGVLQVTDAGGQVASLTVNAEPGALTPSTPLWQALLFAVLGGLILNLMPCVFPVLAMKAFALARLSAESRGTARRHAASYTAGVLVSFAAIGLGLLALRQAGALLGWGFQFQSPAFVAAMAWVLFAVGLNLSGVFEIATGLEGAGQGLAARGGMLGSFGTGALAVLVATPCTAPFMGVALAAALTASPAIALGVFLAMGLGLAAPTVLLALVPAVARALPRPGAWMARLKQALAFPMYAAAAWLLWVTSTQSGPDGVMAVATGLVLTGFAAWVWPLGRRVGRGLAAGAVVAVLALLPGLQQAEAPAETSAAERFTPQRLTDLRAQGRPVFVNMTAAWCVTCLVNERVALTPARAAFDRLNIAYLKGDWTRQDPDITRFLQAQGRDGVPLYVFYPAGGLPPLVLPQILTEPAVLAAIAGGSAVP